VRHSCAALLCAIASCGILSASACKAPPEERDEAGAIVTAQDFARLDASPGSVGAVKVPSTFFDPPTVTIDRVDEQAGSLDIVDEKTVIDAPRGSGGAKSRAVSGTVETVELRPGQSWTVDALVGQINGRPVYASKFLQPLEDRIMRVVSEMPRAQAQQEIARVVVDRFQQQVNSELVIAEAESMLTPDNQQGVLAWLKDVQEQTTASYGGNRTAATRSLEEQFGMTMEQYLNERRDEALANQLLQRRIEPRTIVSWRDVEREYAVNEAEFNPQPTITVGRIAVRSADEAKVKDVGDRLAAGEAFSAVAESAGIAQGGAWREFKLPSGGIAQLEDLNPDVRTALMAAAPGKATPPMRQGSSTVWFTILASAKGESRSIFDARLQLMLRASIAERRSVRERMRYLNGLRQRWISQNIQTMQDRLVRIAWDRYLSGKAS
jgi:hypothetical protein